MHDGARAGSQLLQHLAHKQRKLFGCLVPLIVSQGAHPLQLPRLPRLLGLCLGRRRRLLLSAAAGLTAAVGPLV